ncbi:MAG TPA: hypothetical protein VGV89_03000, partial [Thermoplasmata archaeon]|nr:hypothetical protein [Thermoplasmata archaeon]
AGLVVVLVLVAVAPPRLSVSADHGRWSGADQWTNGVIVASFVPDRPAVTVASVTGEAGYGLYAGVFALEEIGTNGSTVASADLVAAHWSVSNGSSTDQLALNYTASVPVIGSTDGTDLGAPVVSINFTSVAPAANSGSASFVAFGLAVSGWPWNAPQDTLAASMPLWPNNVSLEQLSGLGSSDNVYCDPNDSLSHQEYFSWESQATATWSGGAMRELPTDSQVTGGPRYASVLVRFGSPGTSGYGGLRYDPRVGVLSGAAAPALGLLEYAAIGAGLAGLAIAVVVVQRRAWSRPPSLARPEAP